MLSLTAHLLDLDPAALRVATNHPFLAAAATSQLPFSKLKTWLAQDRLYALSYTTFIGTFISRIPIPTGPNRTSTLEWRTTSLLIDSLTNIRTELDLFERTARDAGFYGEICSPEATSPLRPTACYRDLFSGAANSNAESAVLTALTVLWATEACYLRAWRFARGKMLQMPEDSDGGPKDVMRGVFIPNWSSDEFESFVTSLAKLLDEWAEAKGVKPGSEACRECENAWRQVLWIEEMFWPEV